MSTALEAFGLGSTQAVCIHNALSAYEARRAAVSKEWNNARLNTKGAALAKRTSGKKKGGKPRPKNKKVRH